MRNGREALQPSSRVKLLRGKPIAQGKAKASSQWLKLLGCPPFRHRPQPPSNHQRRSQKIRRSEPPVPIVQRVLSERCLPALLRRPALFFVSLLRCRGKAQGNAARRRSPIKPHLQIKPLRTASAKSCILVLRAPLQRRRMQDIERFVPGGQIGPCKERQDGRQKLTIVKIVSCGLVVPICPRAVRHELKMDVKTRVPSAGDDRSVQLVRNSPGPNAVIPFRLLNSCRGCRFLNAQPMLSRRLKRIKSSSSAVKRGRVKRRSSRRSA